MPSAELGLGIITSSASPSGCHLSASGRTPPMLLDLGEQRADAARHQDGLDLEAPLGGYPDRKDSVGLAVVDPVSRGRRELGRRGADR